MESCQSQLVTAKRGTSNNVFSYNTGVSRFRGPIGSFVGGRRSVQYSRFNSILPDASGVTAKYYGAG